MGFLNIVVGVLLLLFGLKLLSSPAFNSLLSSRLDFNLDYRALPTLGLLVFGTIIVCFKLLLQSRRAEGTRGEVEEHKNEIKPAIEIPPYRAYRGSIPPQGQGNQQERR